MTLSELGTDYRRSAALLKGRITELKRTLAETNMCEMEKLRLRVRIDTLSSMYRDVCDTAVYLEHYYDRGYRRNGRFSI